MRKFQNAESSLNPFKRSHALTRAWLLPEAKTISWMASGHLPRTYACTHTCEGTVMGNRREKKGGSASKSKEASESVDSTSKQEEQDARKKLF